MIYINDIKYYYRLVPLGIDNWSEKDTKKHNKELNSFDELLPQFELLKTSYETLSKERADILVCVLSDKISYLNDVIEICVYHYLRKKLFSKKIVENNYSLCITAGSPNGMDLYSYKTIDFEEVKTIFYDYIVNKKTPDLTNWEVIHF